MLNAKKYLMKNKLLADPSSSSTSTNQSQPSKIVKGRQQSQALRQGTSDDANWRSSNAGGSGGGGRGRGQKAFHTHATHSAPTTPMRAQQQKKSIARIAQQAHQMQQRGPRNNSNNFGNSNSKFQARDSSGGFGDDSNGGESDGGSKPRFVMNKFNNKQQFQQQPRTGMGRGGGQNFHQQQQNSKFVWKKTNNNTNDFGGDGGDYGSGNPKFAHKKALRQNNYGDSNDDGYGGDGDDGSSNGFQPKFVMNKKQQFSNSNSDFDEAPVQKYVPKHLRNQQQNQQMQQQQYQLQMQQQQYQLPPRNASQQPFLVKKAPFVPKAYQNINVANSAQSARAKTNPNSNTRSPAAIPNASAPRPITNAKSPAQSKVAKLQQQSRSATQPPTRSKAESAMISKSMKSGASASAAKKSTSSKQDRATSGSGLSALSHIQDFRSTFGITDVHWTGMDGLRMR